MRFETRDLGIGTISPSELMNMQLPQPRETIEQ